MTAFAVANRKETHNRRLRIKAHLDCMKRGRRTTINTT